MDFQDKKNLFKVRETILEMINDRGYIVPESEIITLEEFIIKYDNKNLDIYIDDTILQQKIYVHFHNELKSFSKSDLKNIMSKIISTYSDPNINIILLLRDKENSAVSKELMKEMYLKVEVFLKKRMVFNITRHQFVPKHIILNEEEEKEILEKYNTSKSKLPKISKNDPIAKYYGMKPDQICKIIRWSPEVGETNYYRLVK
jgi:DNA-directed RNA polymerase I, II, and III subunit RPABC1